MIELRAGQTKDTQQLATLVFDSAPILLSYLFGGTSRAIDYVTQAMLPDDGQYSANRHIVACAKIDNKTKSYHESSFNDELVVGCITLWHDGLSECFHQQTFSSLSSFLSGEQLRHLVAINPRLMQVFVAPRPHELCIGHLAVSPFYQGKGVGKKLIEYAIEQAKRLSKTRIVLDVDADNHKAIRFYQHCDFNKEASTEFAPTQQQFLRMYCEL